MKTYKFSIFKTSLMSVLFVGFIACDKDFTDLNSDILNADVATNFDVNSEIFEVIAYNRALGPVQTNSLALSTLGVFDDVYGRTTSSFVTQLSLGSFDPNFGEGTVLDSVVLTIPYFSRATSIDEDGNLIYTLDSVIGNSPIKLSLFESNFFLRSFNPDAEFGETQKYYSNKSASATETIADAILEAQPLAYYKEDGTLNVENILNINSKRIVLTEPDNDDDDAEPQILQTIAPAIRLVLDNDYWESKILAKEGESVLSSANNFNDYFRGLYFKAEATEDNGSFLILNMASLSANITLYYTKDNPSTAEGADPTIQSTFVLNFSGNRVNFMENDFVVPLADGDAQNGDTRLYLKGGQGSMAQIKLFNGDNFDDIPEMNAFETWKSNFVETEDGKFVRSKRLVNEANLVFYIDKDMVNGNEPDRIYLYDMENNTPLIDYFLDAMISSLPKFSISNHLGILQRVDDQPNGEGIKYKMKITEHINNLLLRDSTNVDLGLAVSLNVNLEEQLGQRAVLGDNPNLTTPVSAVITPRGTVLHGNNTEDETKKVYLEIYYTEPRN